MFEYNLKILNNFCEILSEKKINHLIYISSDAVYEDTKNKINENSKKSKFTSWINASIQRENFEIFLKRTYVLQDLL